MEVLRKQQQMLHTVLEVFIHDPLYRWAVSPQKLKRLQRDDERKDNEQEPESLSQQSVCSGCFF